MGVDLALYPLDEAWSSGQKSFTGNTRLDLNRRKDFFARIENVLKPAPVPLTVTIFLFDKEEVSKDCYNEPLTFVLAGELKKLDFSDFTDERNKAALAYIGCLSDNIPIILWWY